MKHLIQHVRPTRAAKVVGTLALTSMALFTAACAPQAADPGDAGADIEENVELEEAPEGMELDAETIDEPESEVNAPSLTDDDVRETALVELVGETVTVSTEVTETLSPNVFTVYDVESFRGEEVLAITDLPAPIAGENIEVTGEIMELNVALIEANYGITLAPDVIALYEGKPYLAVKAIEVVD
ncbi:MAG: hypothetical protein AAGA01_00715 [Cyanobacteria bacterium P01_E01_bin.43]